MIHADAIKELSKEQVKNWNAVQALAQQFLTMMQTTERMIDKVEGLEKKLNELVEKNDELVQR